MQFDRVYILHNVVLIYNLYNMFLPAGQYPQQGEREELSVKRGDHRALATEAQSQGEVQLLPRGGSAA